MCVCVRARARVCVQVSANTDEENILQGFRSGSNDYVKKPFSRAEVLARCKRERGARARAHTHTLFVKKLNSHAQVLARCFTKVVDNN